MPLLNETASLATSPAASLKTRPAFPRSWPLLAIIFGVWLLLYGSFTVASPPLLDDADSVHAEAAREMLVRHDPVTLYANGIRYLEKAPLLRNRLLGRAPLARRLQQLMRDVSAMEIA